MGSPKKEARTAELVCLPSGRSLTLAFGTNLMEAVVAVGLPLSQSCDGEVLCGFCRVHVVEGRDSLTPGTEEELKVLRSLGADDDERLACCAWVEGPVTVTTDYW